MTDPEVLTAVPVSYDAAGEIDLEGSRSILRFVAQSGNEGAFVLGTTAEFAALDPEEYRAVVEMSVEELADRMRVVAHIGQASLVQARRRLAVARAAGAREFAAITPYFLPASPEALWDYYRRLSEEVGDDRLFVYVFRDRTSNSIAPDLMARLATLPNVVGAKVSGEPLETISAYRAVVPDDFVLYTGSDRELAEAGAAGARGVVSGVSSVFPKPFRALIAALRSADSTQIAQAQAAVDEVVDVVAGDMGRMKATYRLLGLAEGTTRMAIDEPSGEVLARLQRALDRHG